MKAWVLLVLAVTPAAAQVEKVAMRTTGISCGMCAGLSEYYFRRMAGIDQVKISLSNEAILLTYKPGAVFDPAGIRKLLKSIEVGVVQFQISARGRVKQDGAQQFFLAGKDRFLITGGPAVAPDTAVSIEGILNDHPKPMELKILSVKPGP